MSIKGLRNRSHASSTSHLNFANYPFNRPIDSASFVMLPKYVIFDAGQATGKGLIKTIIFIHLPRDFSRVPCTIDACRPKPLHFCAIGGWHMMESKMCPNMIFFITVCVLHHPEPFFTGPSSSNSQYVNIWAQIIIFIWLRLFLTNIITT